MTDPDWKQDQAETTRIKPAAPSSPNTAEMIRILRTSSSQFKRDVADALERSSAVTADMETRLNSSGAARALEKIRADAAEARLADAVEVLKDIEQVNEAEPREPDDADFQFRFLEVKRVVRLALGRVGIQQDSGAD